LIRALAADIDGTLTDERRAISPVAVKAIRSLRVPVVLATGNTHCFTRATAVLLGTPLAFVAENGGVVSYTDEKIELLADPKVCEAAFQELARVFPLERYSSRYRFTDLALRRNFEVEAVSRYIKDRSLPVELIDTSFAVHIKDSRVDKGTGLRRIADHMGLELRDFAAVGDSPGDIPMFEVAGFSACVANAPPELKRIADYVARAKYGEGFAEIVNHMRERGML
jgi:phosphoglycolate phosphatase (TIGR01487 family)